MHGGSYGGGVSFALAMLRDRIMVGDGRLRAVALAEGRAAAPRGRRRRTSRGRDLVYSLQPNGRYLDYTLPGPEEPRCRAA